MYSSSITFLFESREYAYPVTTCNEINIPLSRLLSVFHRHGLTRRKVYHCLHESDTVNIYRTRPHVLVMPVEQWGIGPEL